MKHLCKPSQFRHRCFTKQTHHYNIILISKGDTEQMIITIILFIATAIMFAFTLNLWLDRYEYRKPYDYHFRYDAGTPIDEIYDRIVDYTMLPYDYIIRHYIIKTDIDKNYIIIDLIHK